MIDWINQSGVLKHDVMQTLINIAAMFLIAAAVNRILEHLIKKRHGKNQKIWLKGARLAVLFFLLYGIFNQFAVFSDIITALAASTGILTLALGLAAQDAVGNFVNGLMIITFKPFTIGDLIRLSDYNLTGYVVDISIRHTVIKTYENTQIIVPNSIMNTAILENISEVEELKANFLDVEISYESDLEKAMAIMTDIIVHHKDFIDGHTDPKVVIRLMDFRESGMALRATVYSRSQAEGIALLSDLRIQIKEAFDANGIEIPYPRRVVKMT